MFPIVDIKQQAKVPNSVSVLCDAHFPEPYHPWHTQVLLQAVQRCLYPQHVLRLKLKERPSGLGSEEQAVHLLEEAHLFVDLRRGRGKPSRYILVCLHELLCE